MVQRISNSYKDLEIHDINLEMFNKLDLPDQIINDEKEF